MIRQIDLRAAYLAQESELRAAVQRVLESGWYILGEEVAAFEAEFGQFIGRPVVAVASGTDALELSLMALGIGPGDPVFTVSLTATATVAGIARRGATPVLVDVDPSTFTMDPQRLADAVKQIAPKRGAIVPVHLFGQTADMAAIRQIAQTAGLAVIEDCAQAHAPPAGTLGDMAAFSFYPTKNLAALGDGGAVVVPDMKMREKLIALRQYGWIERHVASFPGVNSRLDEIQAAILRVRLRRLAANNQKRRQHAATYNRLLSETKVVLPIERPGARHVYHQYAIRTPDRDGLRKFLLDRGIETAIHYPLPIHLQPAYRSLAIGPGGLGESESLCRQLLSLPMYPELPESDVQTVADAIRHWSN